MTPIMECVPNFSEGRDLETVEKIADAFRATEGVRLLDYSHDHDHNRMVITAAGEPEALKAAVLDAIGKAIERIDINRHQGQHPRMGAVDVVPFIPIRGCTMDEAVALSRATGKEVSTRFGLPVFLYEKAASAPHRTNLSAIRKGEFEGLDDKMQNPEWLPDFGPRKKHPTAGAVAIGARTPLIAFNVNLGTTDRGVVDDIAQKVRASGGGLRFCKAIGVELTSRGIVQVSMNLTDYSRTTLYRAFELVRIEAQRYGVPVISSEIIGLPPVEALVNTAAYYLRLENFSAQQTLEARLME